MVTRLAAALAWSANSGRLLAEVEQKTEPLIKRLDPVSRTKVVMSLLGLLLLGAALVAMVWLGGRYMRRIARAPFKPADPHQDDWFRKRLDDNPADRERNDR